MSKTRCWITILITLAILIFIGINLISRDYSQVEINDVPSYTSDYNNTVVYNSVGILNYRLISQHIEYFSNTGISCFTQPILTIFDTDKEPTWLIKSNKAKLTNDRILYLYGRVEISTLVSSFQLRKITMDNAKINLLTQDITSQDLVTLYGKTFNSSGLRMRGNLRSKNAELFDKVKTSYEIQNKQNHP